MHFILFDLFPSFFYTSNLDKMRKLIYSMIEYPNNEKTFYSIMLHSFLLNLFHSARSINFTTSKDSLSDNLNVKKGSQLQLKQNSKHL